LWLEDWGLHFLPRFQKLGAFLLLQVPTLFIARLLIIKGSNCPSNPSHTWDISYLYFLDKLRETFCS
jgi:hypothetical protein